VREDMFELKDSGNNFTFPYSSAVLPSIEDQELVVKLLEKRHVEVPAAAKETKPKEEEKATNTRTVQKEIEKEEEEEEEIDDIPQVNTKAIATTKQIYIEEEEEEEEEIDDIPQVNTKAITTKQIYIQEKEEEEEEDRKNYVHVSRNKRPKSEEEIAEIAEKMEKKEKKIAVLEALKEVGTLVDNVLSKEGQYLTKSEQFILDNQLYSEKKLHIREKRDRKLGSNQKGMKRRQRDSIGNQYQHCSSLIRLLQR
jgi:hypothetical protein